MASIRYKKTHVDGREEVRIMDVGPAGEITIQMYKDLGKPAVRWDGSVDSDFELLEEPKNES